MDLTNLNKIVEALDSPKISKFEQNLLSRTAFPGFGYLFICIRPHSLMLYTSVGMLGQEAKYFPKLFELLLNHEISGGRFDNIRATFDSETSVLWLCYDLNLEEVTTESLKNAIVKFVDNAKKYKKLLNTQFLDVYLQTIRESMGKNDEDEYLLSPDMELSCALSLSCQNEKTEKNFDDDIPLEATPEFIAKIRQALNTASGTQNVSGTQSSNASSPAPSSSQNNSQDPELVNVMIAQSMFMLV